MMIRSSRPFITWRMFYRHWWWQFSGAHLGYDCNCNGTQTVPIAKFVHKCKIAHLTIAPNSTTLTTSSWDRILRVWLLKKCAKELNNAWAVIQPEPSFLRLVLWNLQPLLSPEPLNTAVANWPTCFSELILQSCDNRICRTVWPAQSYQQQACRIVLITVCPPNII